MHSFTTKFFVKNVEKYIFRPQYAFILVKISGATICFAYAFILGFKSGANMLCTPMLFKKKTCTMKKKLQEISE